MQAAKSAQEDLQAIIDGLKALKALKATLEATLAGKLDRDSGKGSIDTAEPGSQTSVQGQALQLSKQIAALRTNLDRVVGPFVTAKGFYPEPATKHDLDNQIDQIKSDIDSMSEMGEMESLRLQMAMDRMSKMMSTLSNLLKKISDTAAAITQNLKGSKDDPGVLGAGAPANRRFALLENFLELKEIAAQFANLEVDIKTTLDEIAKKQKQEQDVHQAARDQAEQERSTLKKPAESVTRNAVIAVPCGTAAKPCDPSSKATRKLKTGNAPNRAPTDDARDGNYQLQTSISDMQDSQARTDRRLHECPPNCGSGSQNSIGKSDSQTRKARSASLPAIAAPAGVKKTSKTSLRTSVSAGDPPKAGKNNLLSPGLLEGGGGFASQAPSALGSPIAAGGGAPRGGGIK
jgi:hypothetical protein